MLARRSLAIQALDCRRLPKSVASAQEIRIELMIEKSSSGIQKGERQKETRRKQRKRGSGKHGNMHRQKRERERTKKNAPTPAARSRSGKHQTLQIRQTSDTTVAQLQALPCLARETPTVFGIVSCIWPAQGTRHRALELVKQRWLGILSSNQLQAATHECWAVCMMVDGVEIVVHDLAEDNSEIHLKANGVHQSCLTRSFHRHHPQQDLARMCKHKRNTSRFVRSRRIREAVPQQSRTPRT